MYLFVYKKKREKVTAKDSSENVLGSCLHSHQYLMDSTSDSVYMNYVCKWDGIYVSGKLVPYQWSPAVLVLYVYGCLLLCLMHLMSKYTFLSSSSMPFEKFQELFDVLFVVRLDNLWNKQSHCRWSERQDTHVISLCYNAILDLVVYIINYTSSTWQEVISRSVYHERVKSSTLKTPRPRPKYRGNV